MSENSRLWLLIHESAFQAKAPRTLSIVYPNQNRGAKSNDVIGKALALVMDDRLGDGQLAEISAQARLAFNIETIQLN